MNENKLKWKVNTKELLQLCLEQTSNGSILEKPLQIFQMLLIELAEVGLKINNNELNDILSRLSLIEPLEGSGTNESK